MSVYLCLKKKRKHRHQIHPNEKTIRYPFPSISRLAGEASSLLCGEALEGSSAFELGTGGVKVAQGISP